MTRVRFVGVAAAVLLVLAAPAAGSDADTTEEARFREAEGLRQEGRWPAAADGYCRLLREFPAGARRQDTLRHLYGIANYWLEDTREQMRLDHEVREVDWQHWFPGAPWLPDVRDEVVFLAKHVHQFRYQFHWDRRKPLLGEESRALDLLERVAADPAGPLADRALFLMGSVRFFRGDYRLADHHFSRLADAHPKSAFAMQALECAVVAKMQLTGEPGEAQHLAEARNFVARLRADPELPASKVEFLQRALFVITRRQAEIAFARAEASRQAGFRKRSAAEYEAVARDYPGTKYGDMTRGRLDRP